MIETRRGEVERGGGGGAGVRCFDGGGVGVGSLLIRRVGVLGVRVREILRVDGVEEELAVEAAAVTLVALAALAALVALVALERLQ